MTSAHGLVLALMLGSVLPRARAQAPSVAALSPADGTTDGGFSVVVSGTGFVAGSLNATCRIDGNGGLVYAFAPRYMNATVLSATSLVCHRVPAMPVEGPVHLEVSMDNDTFSSSEQIFTFVQLLDVSIERSLYTENDALAGVIVRVASLAGPNSTASSSSRRSPSPLPPTLPPPSLSSSPSRRRLRTDAIALSTPPHASLPSQAPPPSATVTVLLGSTPLASATLLADGVTESLLTFALEATQFPLGFNDTLTVVASFASPASPATVTRFVRLLRLPARPNQVVISYVNRALVLGTDDTSRWTLYPSGYMISSHEYAEAPYAVDVLRELGRRGHTHVMPYICSAPSNATDPCVRLDLILTYLDACYAAGLRMQVDVTYLARTIYSSNDSASDWALLGTVVDAVANHPALLGYYVSDDLIWFPIQATVNVRTFVVSRDPWHPTFCTVSGSGNTWAFYNHETGLGFDVAQYEAYDLNNPGWQQGTVPTGWPLSYTPAYFCGQGYGGFEDLRDGARLQAVVSPMYGGTGFIAWCWWPWNRIDYAAVVAEVHRSAALLVEFAPQILSPALNNRRVLDVVVTAGGGAGPSDDAGLSMPIAMTGTGTGAGSVGDGPVPVWAAEWQDASGCILIFVINTDHTPAAFQLTSARLAAAAAAANQTSGVLTGVVVLERRFINASLAGVVEDMIDGFDTRAYRFQCPLTSAGAPPFPPDTLTHRAPRSRDASFHRVDARWSVDAAGVGRSQPTAFPTHDSTASVGQRSSQVEFAAFSRRSEGGVNAHPSATSRAGEVSLPGPNLVANPGFEIWTEPGHADSWIHTYGTGCPLPLFAGCGPNPEPLAAVILDSMVAHNGSHSLRVVLPAVPEGEGLLLPNTQGSWVSLPPTGLFTFSFWVRPGLAQNATRAPALGVTLNGTQLWSATFADPGDAFRWQPIVLPAVNASLTQGGLLILGLNGTGQVWLDDVSVVQIA